MPAVERNSSATAVQRPPAERDFLFPRCGNPGCSTGRMHLWRNPRRPRFEGRWACSPACLEAMVASAVRREGSPGKRWAYPHRVPIGLLLLEQGQISETELRSALAARRRHGERTGETVRLGAWLIDSGLLSERALSRGLSAQWSCPTFSLARFRPEETAAVLPRLLAEVCGAIPVRAAGRMFLVCAEAVDRSLSYATARITGLNVTSAMAGDREWRQAQEDYRVTPGPRSDFIEAADTTTLVRVLGRRIEALRAVEARLVRVHEFWWLRVWRRATAETGIAACGAVEDLLGTLRSSAAGY